jgi:anaerobic selenocysteine-containing dehydrogenase
MLHVFVGERLYDNEFVARWTLGFDELKKTLQEYTPEKVQESTGVPADMIRQAARLYGSTKPACIVQGNGLELHADGIQAIRAVSILQAISGNLDVSGGARLNPGHGLASLEIDTAKTAAAAIGADAYPVYYDFRKEAHGNLLADAVLESKPYPIRGMIVTGADPILTFPNAVKMREAMGKLDFLAVMDLFPTETVEHADIVLPAATFLERTELNDLRLRYPLPRIALAQSVLPAQGESWPDLKFWFELARRMGYGEYFPWRDIREAIAFRVKPLGITVEQLEEAPAGLPFMAEQYKKYEEKGFTTPSGKVEIYSQRLKDLGYHPLPTYEIGPACDKVLVISTGARVGEYIHARFRNILSLRKRKPEPFAEISPQTARELGLTDGDMAVIKTKVGEIDIRVQVSEAIIPDAVFVTHGWGEANANILTDDENLDPISGFPLFRSMPCSLERKAE